MTDPTDIGVMLVSWLVILLLLFGLVGEFVIEPIRRERRKRDEGEN